MGNAAEWFTVLVALGAAIVSVWALPPMSWGG